MAFPHMKICRKSGFSLVELIIVIAVIAIISAIIIPSISGTTEAAKEQNAKAAAGTLNMAQVQYRLVNGASTWNDLADADRYTAIKSYMEYSDNNWSDFKNRYNGFSFTFQTLDSSGHMQKVNLNYNNSSNTSQINY
jgi:prepilin-type N-terminal cleavage/methylation domain-containing protein